MVGQYCGVYVWVPPEGRDELTRLTLAILDYALHEPPVRLTKEIIYYVDDLGLPTLQKDAVGTVRATVAINERNEALINISAADELRIEQQLDARLKALRARLADVQAASRAKGQEEKPGPGNAAGGAKGNSEESQLLDSIDLIEHKLQFLDAQLNSTGIREQFYRGGVAPPPFSVIPQLLQQQNALGAQPPFRYPSSGPANGACRQGDRNINPGGNSGRPAAGEATSDAAAESAFPVPSPLPRVMAIWLAVPAAAGATRA